MAKVCLPGAPDVRSLGPAVQSHPPINFFYEHFHNSIRTELESLSRTVAKLTSAPEAVAADLLHVLQNRYRFLEQVHNYHTSVEDEVGLLVARARVAGVWPLFDLMLRRSLLVAGCVSSFGVQGPQRHPSLHCRARARGTRQWSALWFLT